MNVKIRNWLKLLLITFLVGSAAAAIVVGLGVIVPDLDTDGDYLLDYEETDIYGTDPNDADTDGDGLNDHDEIGFTNGSQLNFDLEIAVNSSYAVDASGGTGWVPYKLNPVMTGSEFCGGPVDHNLIAFPRVKEKNGDYQMWYAAYGYAYPSSFNICLANSNNGINWTKVLTGEEYDSVLRQSGQPGVDDGGVGYSDVLSENGNDIMYFNAVQVGNTRVCRATSTDGIAWSYDQDNPVLEHGEPGEWDQGSVSWPTVLKQDNAYYMYYHSYENNSPPAPLGLATSTDGLNWTKYEGNPVLDGDDQGYDSSGIGTFEVLEYENGYLMFYISGEAYPYLQGVCLAYSDDLVDWTKIPGWIIYNNGEYTSGGSVLQQDTLYLLYYMTYNPDNQDETYINVAFNYKPLISITSMRRRVPAGRDIRMWARVIDTGDPANLNVTVYGENGVQLAGPFTPDGSGRVNISIPTTDRQEFPLGRKTLIIKVVDEGQLFSEEEVKVILCRRR